MKLKLIVIFLISFITISSQNMLSYEMELPEVELNLNKPYNKFVARKQVNNKPVVFIAGAFLTGFGIYQLTARRSYNFDTRSVKGMVPLTPHHILIGAGLFTMSISFVIQ
jgi:RsiW-degrading membrane proteinase PrsW (M82 family)